ncbi:MAG TPA: phosphotransferase [Candidatus Latescibacteria bacterium]|nr:phosphotransferase [Candidatus Latescibacterota bacterium]HOF60717.1 phosphotransferase [Candidatus Latescibacterota bacterium]HOS63581.1 phosphotransferase [Candidatus Latescibacterota bacterium]HPK73331.1 phosphotransferase [Candidatus Latescibacterota bacterium]
MSAASSPRKHELSPIHGGASGRRYFRLSLAAHASDAAATYVVMVVPTVEVGTFDAFCSNGEYLRSQSIPAPAILARWRDQGIALLEDFGTRTLTQVIASEQENRRALLEDAIGLLVRLHTCRQNDAFPCPAFQLHFDEEKWRFEYRFHVREWLIARHWKIKPTRAESKILDRAFAWLGARLSREPRVFTHRDYQSSNLLVRDDGSYGLIDFQDARQGLRQYDLASFLYDSYVDLNETERSELSNMYASMACLTISEDEHRYLVTISAIQRKLHDAGAFAYAAYHREKTEYLCYLAPAVTQSVTLMAQIPHLREAGRVLSDYAARATGGTSA